MKWQPRHTMYLAASLSAWGDRMWTFAVGLYMVYATPDSLRLTALYGFVVSGSVILLGAPVGRWVDHTPRLRAAQISLILQNSSVAVCAVILILGLQYADFTARTPGAWLQTFVQVLVIAIADVAALATVANKITIEKDWIVVMAQGDNDRLAWMNSVFRTIDLTTYILAPVLVGQLMTFLSPVVAAIFMASWNVVSMMVEYWLLTLVYRSVPGLAHAKEPDPDDQGRPSAVPPPVTPLLATPDAAPAQNDQTTSSQDQPPAGSRDGLSTESSNGDTSGKPAGSSTPARGGDSCCRRVSSWLQQRAADLRLGWTAYFSSDFRFAGLALASLHMTVLGFGNITAGYGYSQSLSESTLSLLTAAGALLGICGSLCFPRLRSLCGLTRAGLVGFSLAVLGQTLSPVSVFLPGTPFEPLAGSDRDSSIVSVSVLFSGIISARLGLWVSDLSVTQLLQERVPEARRGVVAGVQNALNMTLDTVKCLLVVLIPRPEHFGLLIFLSYGFWVIGWCFYAVYAFTVGLRQEARSDNTRSPEDAQNTVSLTTGPERTARLSTVAESDDVTGGMTSSLAGPEETLPSEEAERNGLSDKP